MLELHFPDAHYTSLTARTRRQLARLAELEPLLHLIRQRAPTNANHRAYASTAWQQAKLRASLNP